MATKLVDNVFKIPGDCNVYLYLGDHPFVIDTGQPSERNYVANEIEKIIPLENIKSVILTHLHYDHCGNVNLFSNAKIFASKAEIDDYNSRPEVFFFGKVPFEIKCSLDKMLPLPKNEINGLKIGFVPGHTCGSVYFIDEKNRFLFSGDTVFRNGVGRTDFPNSVPEKMEESIMKLLKDLKNKNLELMPGHDY